MAVVRVNKTKDYSVMSNNHFREKAMSLKAKGLLSLMLSLPETWDYSIAGLVTLSKDGKDSVMNALNELEDFGYLVRTRLKDKKGKFAGYDYDIYENPQAVKSKADNSNTEKPCAEKPNTEKSQQYNTNKLNTNKKNTKQLSTNKSKKESQPEARPSFNELIDTYANGNEEIKDLLGEWLKIRKIKNAVMTNKTIELNLQNIKKYASESNMEVIDYLKEVICRGLATFTSFKTNNKTVTTNKSGNVFFDMLEKENKVI